MYYTAPKSKIEAQLLMSGRALFFAHIASKNGITSPCIATPSMQASTPHHTPALLPKGGGFFHSHL